MVCIARPVAGEKCLPRWALGGNVTPGMSAQPRAGHSSRSESEAASEHAARPVQAAAGTGHVEPVADSRRADVESATPSTDATEASDETAISDVDALAAEIGGGEDSAFGTALEPVLRRACEAAGGALATVSWFRTDWQRGGALTGTADYTDEAGVTHRVVVKLPVPPCERHWLAALQSPEQANEVDGANGSNGSGAGDGEVGSASAIAPVVPRIYAHGAALNGYDLAWVVMEHLPFGPLGSDWEGREFDLLIEAAGRFYAAADHLPVTGAPQQADWEALLERARQQVRDKALPEPQRWSKALKKAQRKLKQWAATWEQRPVEGWCHGDLHLANALTRTPAPDGPALLIDFARTRAGHWLEDAVYLEHLYWARPQRLGGRKLCKQIAHERKAHGLSVEKDWAKLAEAKRCLLAATTPAHLRFDGDPQHLAAALAILESAVK